MSDIVIPFDPKEQPTWLRIGREPGDIRGGVTVDSVEVTARGTIMVRYYPMGGGCLFAAPWTKFEKRYSPLEEGEMRDRTPELAYFGFDDGPVLMGFTFGGFWNGWACPHVTREAIEAWLVRALHDNEFPWLKVRDGRVFYESEEPDESYEIEAETVMWEGRPIEVYDVSCGLCWNEDLAASVDLGLPEDSTVKQILEATVPEELKAAHEKVVTDIRILQEPD